MNRNLAKNSGLNINCAIYDNKCPFYSSSKNSSTKIENHVRNMEEMDHLPPASNFSRTRPILKKTQNVINKIDQSQTLQSHNFNSSMDQLPCRSITQSTDQLLNNSNYNRQNHNQFIRHSSYHSATELPQINQNRLSKSSYNTAISNTYNTRNPSYHRPKRDNRLSSATSIVEQRRSSSNNNLLSRNVSEDTNFEDAIIV